MQHNQDRTALRPFLNMDSNVVLITDREPRADVLVTAINGIAGLNLEGFTTTNDKSIITFKNDRVPLSVLNELYVDMGEAGEPLGQNTYLTSQVDTEGGIVGATRPFADVTLQSIIGLEFPANGVDTVTIQKAYNTLMINNVNSTPISSDINLTFKNNRKVLTDNNSDIMPSLSNGTRVDSQVANKLGVSTDKFVFVTAVQGKFIDG